MSFLGIIRAILFVVAGCSLLLWAFSCAYTIPNPHPGALGPELKSFSQIEKPTNFIRNVYRVFFFKNENLEIVDTGIKNSDGSLTLKYIILEGKNIPIVYYEMGTIEKLITPGDKDSASIHSFDNEEWEKMGFEPLQDVLPDVKFELYLLMQDHTPSWGQLIGFCMFILCMILRWLIPDSD